MNGKKTTQQIKNKILGTNLVSVSRLNKEELLQLENKIDTYLLEKQKDYKNFIFGNKIISLNDDQFSVVADNINISTRIVACAGSGKTTTIICRIKFLIDSGVNPENILLTTFNVDAAENMKIKIIELFGFMPKIIIGTFDSISCKFYYKYFKKDYYVGISEYSTEFLNYLKSDDGHHIYSKIKYVFFDEFQDCNTIQFNIIKELYNKGSIITVIGDDAQNIYQWRGSNIDFILNFDKYMPDTKTYKLVDNYRSTPEIVTIANISIKNNTDQIPKDMIATNKSISFKPEIKKYSNELEQAEYIIDKILDYLHMGISLDEIAIISRNNYSLKIIEENLEKFNKTSPIKLPYVALITEDNSDNKPKIIKNHITLTSIHKSKGLEWQIVFMISCNDDKFPSELDKISIQEERRLFYVSITRAKTYLHISFTNKTISRFVYEIPLNYLNFINFSADYFKFDNHRNIKYKNDVSSLIEMVEPTDIEDMRSLGILPQIFPTIKNVHSSYDYDEEINKYYLHPDFGIFIDRYISRLIGQKNSNSNGLMDRTAERIICSVQLDPFLFFIYNRYQLNFYKKISLISIKVQKNNYINILDKTTVDPIYIKKIEFKDYRQIEEIIRLIIKKANILKMDPKEILVLPYNYLPNEFISKMEKSYVRFKNPKKNSIKILKDIYKISLCENISDGRRRLLYKNVFNCFSKNINLFDDIENSINQIVSNELICKKIVFDEKYDIVGELDLLDLTNNKIIDYKCSVSSECKLEWILQLLTYASIIKRNGLKIKIDYIEFYNPMLGSISTIDITNWNNEELLLKKLFEIRERNL